MAETSKPQEAPSYTRMTGEVYDVIYSNKDYEGESVKLEQLIKDRCESGGNEMLEAACGTGNYLQYFQTEYQVEGFDLSPEQVADARKNSLA